ncbi:hypothetical protein [Natrarchaeobius oligotrophus]|uniref:hypothetical protein n=1 Tax=Natrarchaeobius oligotrophus TaxID=3455743 RepID=UPI000F540A86|nr:hypothetical protein [Natrarchaeobius chitinivorans]
MRDRISLAGENRTNRRKVLKSGIGVCIGSGLLAGTTAADPSTNQNKVTVDRAHVPTVEQSVEIGAMKDGSEVISTSVRTANGDVEQKIFKFEEQRSGSYKIAVAEPESRMSAETITPEDHRIPDYDWVVERTSTFTENKGPTSCIPDLGVDKYYTGFSVELNENLNAVGQATIAGMISAAVGGAIGSALKPGAGTIIGGGAGAAAGALFSLATDSSNYTVGVEDDCGLMGGPNHWPVVAARWEPDPHYATKVRGASIDGHLEAPL